MTTTNVNPVFDTTPVVVRIEGSDTLNVPDGTWLFMVVDGVVSGVDLVNGGWTVGNEHIKTYQTSQSLISPASVGDEVLFFCVRTLTPGPLTIESTYNILAGPLIQPYKPTAVEVHPMYNGNIVSMGPTPGPSPGPPVRR